LRPRSSRFFELPYSFFFRPGGGIGKPADAMNATKPDRVALTVLALTLEP
jgi:hypothetical protein